MNFFPAVTYFGWVEIADLAKGRSTRDESQRYRQGWTPYLQGINQFLRRLLNAKSKTGAGAIKKFTPSLGIPYLYMRGV